MKKINVIILSIAASMFIFGFMYNRQQQEKIIVGTDIGNKAPDLLFNDTEGKPLALSSLKGKIVLIDFWASWCGPCRMENPNVVNVYRKYKNTKFKKAKGFTVYSVSLDSNRDAWLNAINRDQLEWKNHVSDFGGWNSAPAKIYGVNFIPYNFLVDAKGIIIAKNLRGQDLGAAIERLITDTR